jgi:predicted PurR-regulated permease PerM
MDNTAGVGQRRSLMSLAILVAGIAIVLGALHLAATVVAPFLLGMVLALIFWPVFIWLRTHCLGIVASLLVLVVGLALGVGLIVLVIGSSISGMASRLDIYTQELSARLQSLDAWFASNGIHDVNLASVLTSALYQGFVILLLPLFFLVEGQAIADRIRLSLDEGNPNPARLAKYGRDVGQYFALRAAVNAITGTGVAIVLWLLVVDVPLLWGVLTFFLSFIRTSGCSSPACPASFSPGLNTISPTRSLSASRSPL